VTEEWDFVEESFRSALYLTKKLFLYYYFHIVFMNKVYFKFSARHYCLILDFTQFFSWERTNFSSKLAQGQLNMNLTLVISFKWSINCKHQGFWSSSLWQLAENFEIGVQFLGWAKSLTPGFALINHFYMRWISQSGLIFFAETWKESSLTHLSIEN